MVWPPQLLRSPPAANPPSGYELRTYRRGDESGFFKVMELAGFEGFDADKLQPWLPKILPDGWFFIISETTQEFVATTMALHNPTDRYPFGGELGWVAGHPLHAGKGLGLTVCAAVVRRFLDAGYRTIYLKTDSWRLPAIRTYLKLGFVPLLFAPDMPERWQAVCEKVSWSFTPSNWHS